jgi:hypothetical protein
MQKRIAFSARHNSKLRHDARILMRQACCDQAKEGLHNTQCHHLENRVSTPLPAAI